MSDITNSNFFRWIEHNLANNVWSPEKGWIEEDEDENASATHEVVRNLLSFLKLPEDFVPKYLASGSDAEVYWLKDKKKVLKLTVSEDDAKAMLYFKNHPNKGVIKVYDVFKIPGTMLYGIVAEKLTPASSQWKEIGNKMPFVARKAFILNNAWFESFAEEIERRETSFPKSKIVQALTPEAMDTIKNWCAVLTKAGIKWADMHGDNIMMRGRQTILMDLGRSAGASGTIPKMH